MADAKISELSAATALAGTEKVPVVQAGASVAATVNQIRAGRHPGYISGNWYAAPRASAGVGTGMTTGTLHATPIVIHHPVTIQALGVRVTGAASGGEVVMGIYDNVSGRPGSLLGQTGAVVATNATATNASGALSGGNLSLEPGIYWLAVSSNASNCLVVHTGSADTNMYAMLGGDDISDVLNTTSGHATGVGVSFTHSNTLPSSFGTASLRQGGAGTAMVAFQAQ